MPAYCSDPPSSLTAFAQAKEDASSEIKQCEALDKQRAVFEARTAEAHSSDVSQLSVYFLQADEKAAERAVNEALLKLGNIVHDSVLVDTNEACSARERLR